MDVWALNNQGLGFDPDRRKCPVFLAGIDEQSARVGCREGGPPAQRLGAAGTRVLALRVPHKSNNLTKTRKQEFVDI